MNEEAIKAYNEAIEKSLKKRIGKLLADNKMAYDYSIDEQGFIKIVVDNGDYEHDHLALERIMAKAGYYCFGRHIDDSFSVVYLFR
jgi:hypothetical protein